MATTTSWRVISLLTAIFLNLIISTACHSSVNINGRIEIWNPITNTYEPLRQARVRAVLAEDFDADTRDVEATTNDDGYYSVNKGNPWWRDQYQTYLIVFAEVPNRLEIQSHYMQVDGYQAFGYSFISPQNRSTNANLKIGGSQASVSSYRVGGIALLGNSDGADANTGWRAFFLCHEMTDHRRALMSMSASGDDFEEKEVSFPLGVPVANYMPIDYIRFPDLHFRNNLEASKVSRHELSHGIMADVYGSLDWPGLTHYLTDGLNANHFAAMRNPVPEWAWVEGWADFLGEFTTARRYARNFQDYETQDADWRRRLTDPDQDRWNVEGEISAALWDIADGTGFEKRLNQDPAIPGEEQFYDGLSDASLRRIWDIFKRNEPDMFVHDDDGGDDNHSFVHYWLSQWPGDKYQLKNILYNRGIFMGQASENRPTVALDPVRWDGNIARVRATLTEPDPEDRENIWIQIFVNGSRRERFRLADPWNGDSNEYTYEYINPQLSITGNSQNRPTIMVAVDDGMLSASTSVTLDQSPSATTIASLDLYLLSVRITNPIRSWANMSVMKDIRLLFRQGKQGVPMAVPEQGSWSVPAFGEFVYDTPTLLTTINDPSGPVSFTLGLEGLDSSGKQPKELRPLGSINQSFTEDQSLGIGVHTVNIAMPNDFVAEVTYSITPPVTVKFSLDRSALDRVLAQTRNPVPSQVIYSKELRTSLLEKKKSPRAASQLLDKASGVLARYARLQSSILESEQDIESKMSKQSVAINAKSEKQSRKAELGFTPKLHSLKPMLRSDVAIIDPPTVLFLDQDMKAGGLVESIPAKGQPQLQELQQSLGDLQKEMDVLRAEAQQLRESMLVAIENLNLPDKVDATARQEMQTKLQEMVKRIDEMLPSIDAWMPILVKQSTVIDYSLTLPVNGDVIEDIKPAVEDPSTVKPRKSPLKGEEPIEILPDPKSEKVGTKTLPEKVFEPKLKDIKEKESK